MDILLVETYTQKSLTCKRSVSVCCGIHALAHFLVAFPTVREPKHSRRPRPSSGTKVLLLAIRPVHPSMTVMGRTLRQTNKKLQVVRAYAARDENEKGQTGEGHLGDQLTEVEFHIKVASVVLRGHRISKNL
jgi:hypothetical protein